MENVMFTVRMMAAMMKISIEDLADKCEIERAHLKQVSAGNVKMTAYDLRQLSKITGIPADNIAID